MTRPMGCPPKPAKKGVNTAEGMFRLLGAEIVVDTREPVETSWRFEGLPTVREKLDEGDYSIRGFEKRIAVERKSTDLILSLTYERERFERELVRLSTFERAVIIVEAHLDDIMGGMYRSAVRPAVIVGSVGSIFARFNIPTLFAGNRGNAEYLARVFLVKCWRRLREADMQKQGAA